MPAVATTIYKVRATADFLAAAPEEVSFRKGQAFYVLSSNADSGMYFVSTQYATPFSRTAVSGLVPIRKFEIVDLMSKDPPPQPLKDKEKDRSRQNPAQSGSSLNSDRSFDRQSNNTTSTNSRDRYEPPSDESQQGGKWMRPVGAPRAPSEEDLKRLARNGNKNSQIEFRRNPETVTRRSYLPGTSAPSRSTSSSTAVNPSYQSRSTSRGGHHHHPSESSISNSTVSSVALMRRSSTVTGGTGVADTDPFSIRKQTEEQLRQYTRIRQQQLQQQQSQSSDPISVLQRSTTARAAAAAASSSSDSRASVVLSRSNTVDHYGSLDRRPPSTQSTHSIYSQSNLSTSNIPAVTSAAAVAAAAAAAAAAAIISQRTSNNPIYIPPLLRGRIELSTWNALVYDPLAELTLTGISKRSTITPAAFRIRVTRYNHTHVIDRTVEDIYLLHRALVREHAQLYSRSSTSRAVSPSASPLPTLPPALAASQQLAELRKSSGGNLDVSTLRTHQREVATYLSRLASELPPDLLGCLQMLRFLSPNSEAEAEITGTGIRRDSGFDDDDDAIVGVLPSSQFAGTSSSISRGGTVRERKRTPSNNDTGSRLGAGQTVAALARSLNRSSSATALRQGDVSHMFKPGGVNSTSTTAAFNPDGSPVKNPPRGGAFANSLSRKHSDASLVNRRESIAAARMHSIIDSYDSRASSTPATRAQSTTPTQQHYRDSPKGSYDINYYLDNLDSSTSDKNPSSSASSDDSLVSRLRGGAAAPPLPPTPSNPMKKIQTRPMGDPAAADNNEEPYPPLLSPPPPPRRMSIAPPTTRTSAGFSIDDYFDTSDVPVGKLPDSSTTYFDGDIVDEYASLRSGKVVGGGVVSTSKGQGLLETVRMRQQAAAAAAAAGAGGRRPSNGAASEGVRRAVAVARERERERLLGIADLERQRQKRIVGGTQSGTWREVKGEVRARVGGGGGVPGDRGSTSGAGGVGKGKVGTK
ncbi:hypothetical protein BJ742DRAFT_375638 [Cladochytrium replicatum]|nr:hypothetical protein BJ742DRAFT_375638 [Cladochytrium replicatum]